MSKQFVALDLKRVMTHVGVGMGAASFWRGAWYTLDDHLFPEDKFKSALASFVLGVGGMTASQGLVAKCEELASRKNSAAAASTSTAGAGAAPGAMNSSSRSPTTTSSSSSVRKPSFFAARRLQVYRFGALYTIAVSCVLVWRGTWIGWDVLYEYTHPEQTPCRTGIKSTDPGHLSTSGMLSHVLAVTALCGTGLFASVLAPPAATSIIRDWAVQTGTKPYHGPAGKLLERLWAKTPHSQPLMARTFSHSPLRSMPNRTVWTNVPLTSTTNAARLSSFHQRRGL